jgi:flagellar biosynthesis/type III secretory pathway protein FliH
MLLTEWNWDDALAVRWEEGREEGLEKGLERGREEGLEKGRKKRDGELLTLIEKGYSVEQLRNVLTLREAEPEYP